MNLASQPTHGARFLHNAPFSSHLNTTFVLHCTQVFVLLLTSLEYLTPVAVLLQLRSTRMPSVELHPHWRVDLHMPEVEGCGLTTLAFLEDNASLIPEQSSRLAVSRLCSGTLAA